MQLTYSVSIKNQNNQEDTNIEIRNELYKTFALLGQKSELLSIIGSWKDSMSDKDILNALKNYNNDLKNELNERLSGTNNL